MTIDKKNVNIVQAALDLIRRELDRVYWNKYQKTMKSPFDNTGETYSNNIFTVRAYNWNDGDTQPPNFEYKDLKVYWYKYSGRGVEVYTDNPLTIDFLTKMLDDCFESLKNDFGEKYW